MRVFQTLTEAESEIRRDLSKGPEIISTRVQQQTGLALNGRERMGYQYSVMEVPSSVSDLIRFGKEHFQVYRDHELAITSWLKDELYRRLYPNEWYDTFDEDPPDCSEIKHPLLKSTLEGNYPSYTYQARMVGARQQVARTLRANPDTRRAYWPIYLGIDALRNGDPTRVPCSLGYSAMIRDMGDGQQKLILFYLERSCDFDHFWLSDVFFARKFQAMIAEDLGIKVGALIHYIISFHSFDVATAEIY